jgi:type III pantothenate kinase
MAILDSLNESEIHYETFFYPNLYEQLETALADYLVSEIIVCNVSNPAIFHTIYDIGYKLWRIEARLIATEQNKHGLSTRYENPRLLGTDRWLAMIAAKNEFSATVCIIDCGTAVTIDVVTEEGMHIGGLITPGLKTSRDALGMKANNLPLIENAYVEKRDENYNNRSSFLAINTQDAIMGGTLYQISAYIERIVSEIKEEFGENTECIITGGDAGQIQSLTLHKFHHRQTLVLDGLRIIAKDMCNSECL